MMDSLIQFNSLFLDTHYCDGILDHSLFIIPYFLVSCYCSKIMEPPLVLNMKAPPQPKVSLLPIQFLLELSIFSLLGQKPHRKKLFCYFPLS